MIILDTNVVSEPLRPAPEPAVVAWLDAQAADSLYLTAVTVAELRLGAALLPAGKRRDAVQDAIEKDVIAGFAGRILAFDLGCSQPYADMVARARAAGQPVSTADAIIAAIAAANGMAVATRDTRPFGAIGLKVFNPWA
ncbi:MAG: type II toxin-antitoxin system VapC family toxin [Bifidobacteriaceae bacterium]|nr:type II toxin-antitoxin system VapC family toxin [Bifidobacteriaceae bacterium]